jgi:hypothetical protein
MSERGLAVAEDDRRKLAGLYERFSARRSEEEEDGSEDEDAEGSFAALLGAAEAALAEGDFPRAVSMSLDCLDIARQEVEREPGSREGKFRLFAAWKCLGYAASGMGWLEEAAEYFGHRTAVAMGLASEEPNDGEVARMVWTSYWQEAQIAEKRGLAAEAERFWQLAYTTLTEIRRKGLEMLVVDLEFHEELRGILADYASR